MLCPGCAKEVTADRRFCTWCERYIPAPGVGTKAGVGRRFLATILDGVVFWMLFFFVLAVLGGMFSAAGGRDTAIGGVILGMFMAWVGYFVVLLWFLSRGLTPGKLLVNEKVIEHLRGGSPGLARMILREMFGKFLSGLFFGLGYFWAIWDKDGQAWHDKIAGTVVVTRTGGLAIQPPGTAASGATTAGPFCTQCGVRAAAGQPFCSSCGTDLR